MNSNRVLNPQKLLLIIKILVKLISKLIIINMVLFPSRKETWTYSVKRTQKKKNY